MRLERLTVPSGLGEPREYLGRLRNSLVDSFLKVRRVVNRNDAAASTKSMEWFTTPGTLGYGVEYASGTGYETVCSAADPNTAKVVTGVSVKNNAGGPATVNLFVRTGGSDYRVYQAASVAAGTTAFIPLTYVLHGDWYLRGYAAGLSIDYTSHYSVEPYGTELEVYNVSGGCAVDSEIQSAIGTGVNVLLNEPKASQRHLIRTVALGNHFTATPTTTLSIREISTTNVYDIGVWTYAAYAFNSLSHVNDGMLVLKPDTELILQHSADPLAFAASVHYATVDVTSGA